MLSPTRKVGDLRLVDVIFAGIFGIDEDVNNVAGAIVGSRGKNLLEGIGFLVIGVGPGGFETPNGFGCLGCSSTIAYLDHASCNWLAFAFEPCFISWATK